MRNTNTVIDLVETINGSDYTLKEKEFAMDNINEFEDCVRQCTICGDLMLEGYCIEGGTAYYCSDKCMADDNMSKELFEELFDNGNGDTYWTSWI